MANDVYQSKYTAVQIEQKLDDVGSLKTENSTQNDLISSLSTSTSELESVASSLSNENSTQNSHLNSLSTENSTQTSEIISLSTAESELSSEVEMLNSEVAEKQDSLTAGDNITITNNVIEATGTGALDLSKIIPPGQRTPDEFEVAITDPQEGQVMKYNATTEQWENGSGELNFESLSYTYNSTYGRSSTSDYVYVYGKFLMFRIGFKNIPSSTWVTVATIDNFELSTNSFLTICYDDAVRIAGYIRLSNGNFEVYSHGATVSGGTGYGLAIIL